jgi:hypothetical protein
MTFDERVRALSYLDLTPRQTSFLVTVALNSGFCLRRQFAAFAGLEYGKNVRNFLDRLVERGLARRLTFDVNRGLVYHVHARAIYRAIGQEDNRNRRATSPALVARKLMLLDFVLSQPADEWFATEQDKVTFFADRFQIPLAHLPRRVYVAEDIRTEPSARYFIDKFPVFLAGQPPTVRFVCLVTEPNVQPFTRFLWDHRGLFTRLPAWAVVLISPPATIDIRAFTSAFEAFVTGSSRPPAMVAADGRDDLRWYFTTRRAVEANDVQALSVKSIERFHRARRQFAGALFESLYADWLNAGDAALASIAYSESSPASAIRTAGHLVTKELPFTYSQFGKLPGVA